MFAVIVTSKEAKSGVAGHPVMTQDGQRFWAMVDPESWVEATSIQCDDDINVPPGAKTFHTRAEADAFCARWTGHPWWCIPKGFEVVPVEPVSKSVPAGYRRVG